MFAVVRGRLRVHHGERSITHLGPGSTVGELAALVPEPRSASVTALEPTTLLRIDRPLLEELLADRPALAAGIIAALVAMVRERAQLRDRYDARRDRSTWIDGRSGPLADGSGGGIRRDGRAAGHRRQRDVPRRVWHRPGCRRPTSRSAPPGSPSRVRSPGRPSASISWASRSSCSALRQSRSESRGSSPGPAARGCQCRCWSCSRS